ncbi:MAG: HEAT repeat domain-containing protein [Candidatus Aadella gelida]|nr:HEAT repeat domain-containing protein [Candidatus Aadella gelida]
MLKKTKKILLLLCGCIFLYYAISFGYWYLLAWSGPKPYYAKINRIKNMSTKDVTKLLHNFDPLSPYPGLAVKVLAERGDKEAVPALIKLLSSWNKYIRRDAIWALGIIGDNRAVEPLMNIVKKGEKHPDFRPALVALSDMKYDGVFSYIVEIAKKEYPENCGAIGLLKEFNKPESIPLLLEIKSTIKDGIPNAKFYKSSIDDAVEYLEQARGQVSTLDKSALSG